ncbi:esterase/lipase family protein [Schlesneria sp. T3-172]|uniref:esterase/lipase family protein n=1 Tax=Schlesneria sphaerica TaxID=3373610 RepID=UPI0037C8C198
MTVAMQALFVHGMGRSPITAFPLLRQLKQNGFSPSWYFYSVTFQNFTSISRRLEQKIERLAAQGDYVLIGHSLGGVLLREAVATLPPGTRMPTRIILLGSPVRPSRIAKALKRNWLFRLATSDCGQLLASDDRMEHVAASQVPTTSIIGTKSLGPLKKLFGDEENDCVVSYSEVCADWITEEIRLPVSHTFMPSNSLVVKTVIECLKADQPVLSPAPDQNQ